ncbi:unnamed protein product [Blepharisma stoltei]|uniref:O-methyltransferase n=1 Tax=Blepharisma stoltei TaxID=1481888 RepID=A0AAU9J895_9CILI|nr:unnamed protein product [Blepharisma stoltei]
MAIIIIMANLPDRENIIEKILLGPQLGVVLYSVLDLNIPQILESGPKTSEEISQIVHTVPEKLHRVLLALETEDIFRFNPQTNQFSNSQTSRLFLNENYAGCAKMCLLPFRYELLTAFPESLRTTTSLPEIKYKKSYLQYLITNPENMDKYLEGAKFHVKYTCPDLVRAINLSDINRVLDVGGYDGTLLIELSKVYPQITGAVYNETHFRPIATKKIEEELLSNRLKALAGNYIDAVPEGYECIILENVLRTFPDNVVVSILTNCKKALISGNKLYCVDYILDKNHQTYQFERILDIRVLGLNNGKVRSRDEIQAIFERAGLRITNFIPAVKQWVIESHAM